MNLGVMSSGMHKVVSVSPMLAPYGVHPKWVEVRKDILEVESTSPREVLRGKLEDFGAVAASTLRFYAECLNAPLRVAGVFDVLGLSLATPVDRFSQALEVQKKPDKLNAIHVAAEHFSRMRDQKLYDGFVWSALVPSAAVARVDRSGFVDMRTAKYVWDNPTCYGYSIPLVDLLANASTIQQLIDSKLLDPAAFNCRSIKGKKEDKIARSIIPLATAWKDDGLSMQIRYSGKRWDLDQKSDMGELDKFFAFLDGVGDNATPGLAQQLARCIYNIAGQVSWVS